MVARPGVPALIAAEATEATEVPVALVPVTVKVYESPLVRPVTVTGLTVLVPVAPSPLIPGLVTSVAVTV